MNRRILASRDDYETRLAVIEDGILAEYYFERTDQKRLAGNIYKGRVVTIVPGMEAAFVDIGLGRNSFLYAADVRRNPDELSLILAEENGEADADGDAVNPTPASAPSIRDLLKDGQEILVQIDKEPIGTKGSRVTTNVSLPGRYLVYLPIMEHVGVSLKIEDRAERERLRQVATSLLGPGRGVIVRTAAEGKGEDELRDDIQRLQRQWERILRTAEKAHAPAFIHRDLGLVGRIVRDLCGDSAVDLIVDHPSLYEEVCTAMEDQGQSKASRITFHEGNASLMKETGVEAEVQTLMHRKVWLPSGGYIVIDEAEALTPIDVNTGRYLGTNNLEETALATNLEAAAEIARQIRLRDIGGIIILDFIDMKEEISRRTVLDGLREHLRKDRSRTHILQLTQLGLVEMTRKRVRKSLNKSLTQPCPYCKREGTILSLETMIVRVLRRMEEMCKTSLEDTVVLRVHERIAMHINEEMVDELEELRTKYSKEVVIEPVRNFHFEEIREGHISDRDVIIPERPN